MKQLIKEMFFKVAALFPGDMNGRASILMYHSVSDRTDGFLTVPPDEFRKQMKYLKESGREVLPLATLLERITTKTLKGGEIALTFDDGYRDNFIVVFPILKEFGLHATIFVTTGSIGGSGKRGENMLTEADLKEMQASGHIDIEPHTVTHPKLAELDRETAIKEIRDSKEMLEKMLGKTCELFAYPYGNHNDESVELARELGLRCAVTVVEGSVTNDTDIFRLNRSAVDKLTSWDQFLGKLSRTIDRYHTIKRL